MMIRENSAMMPFSRYVSLYTLHQVETLLDSPPAPGLTLLRIQIATLHYSFAPLVRAPHRVNAAYADDPRAGAERVRETVLPRLFTLLDAENPFDDLFLTGSQDAQWQRYAAERHLPAAPVRLPAIDVPARTRLPAHSRTSERLAQAQRALELLHTTAQTAATLAALWQNWQIGRERQKLMAAQRHLLQDTIQAQLAGQDRALDRARDRDFVRGYLADHAGDTAYQVIFGEDID